MKDIVFHSQAKQDQFIFDLLVKGPGEGRFMDIGCGPPIENNNTYSLEQIGWRGLLMDLDPANVTACLAERKSPVVQADATTYDWNKVPWKAIDYLSLDVDEANPIVLPQILEAGISFRAATIEHDAYRFGNGPRQAMRDMMQQAGYRLLLGDIAVTPTLPFEDWWVSKDIASIMFDLTPYLSQDTTILPAIPCIPCGKQK